MAVIRPQGLAGVLRECLKYVTIGEVLVCVLQMMVFDISTGLMHALTVWIDFMAYSTMHWCQAIVLIFISCIDLGMLVYSWVNSDSY